MILTGETEEPAEKRYTAWEVDGWIIMEQWWNDTDRETEVPGEKLYTAWEVYGWMSREHLWNDTDRETEGLAERPVNDKSHMDYQNYIRPSHSVSRD
jgi:hypothetical protein